VSVYDDTGMLVSEYLRGVSFPVSKQDLLHMARSSNAGAGLLHSIEGMAERSYAARHDALAVEALRHVSPLPRSATRHVRLHSSMCAALTSTRSSVARNRNMLLVPEKAAHEGVFRLRSTHRQTR
jgi:hypothetical protein